MVSLDTALNESRSPASLAGSTLLGSTSLGQFTPVHYPKMQRIADIAGDVVESPGFDVAVSSGE